MTLQEAKDEVAKKYDFTDWWSLDFNKTNLSQEALRDEAAELYARSKWDEAATLTNRNIIHHTNLSMIDLPDKPEFKP